MTQNENNNYKDLYKPMTDYLEMQFNQLCVIAVTDIKILKSLVSSPPKPKLAVSLTK